ncbi:hypothetical protein SLEP1_g21479 [Rubroshorea leprosula]|uniref:Protein MIZU-KUSSEI 1-like n=1 Tax=Rubroshorea leprosula TaxID=152421 RepID=A0AAV5JI34_9ROSI|nr:hypothetical protein SLEP1_g21479 [Rubroshorea leprosula]
MTMIDALRRFFLPCFTPTTTAATTRPATSADATNKVTPTKKRLSASLRDDLDDQGTHAREAEPQNQENDSQESTSTTDEIMFSMAPPRPSKSMVIGTIFGHRKGHVWFCIQHDRLSSKPSLLLELSIHTHQLVQEMRCDLVRIVLECDRSELCSCPLRLVPVFTLFCNGRKIGFAWRRKTGDQIGPLLKTMQSINVGAGVIPAGFRSSDSEEIMYMRANYEHVVGSADSESFHLINPDECPGQELSVFLIRSS